MAHIKGDFASIGCSKYQLHVAKNTNNILTPIGGYFVPSWKLEEKKERKKLG